MPNSQDFDQTPNSPLAKLLEVDSELAVTEAELLFQLKSVQEKRRSLNTVISMFTEVDIPATVSVELPLQAPPAETNGNLERVNENLVAPSLEISMATTTAETQTEAVSNPQSSKAKTKASSPTRKNKTTRKFTQKALVTRRDSGWQDYVREEFSNASLPEAVALILQREPDRVVEISAVMNTIFVDELPQKVENKARRQVSNILSAGARKNKWYRSQLGQYSMSRAAAETNAA